MYYGRVYRRPGRFWSDAERFALDNDIFFGEVLDDPDASDGALLSERPSLERLLTHAFAVPLPLVVLIGNMDRDLGHSRELKAVVARWLLDRGAILYTDLGRRDRRRRYDIVTPCPG
jgi:hypothetical protein